MSNMSISLSDKMRAQIKARVASGDYHNESEYIRDLLRRDEEEANAHKQLLQSLEEAVRSGISERSLEDIVASVKLRLKNNAQISAF